jgi:catechol 2,3-dioxygenase-like lactoylglutathione lyase family enzyme
MLLKSTKEIGMIAMAQAEQLDRQAGAVQAVRSSRLTGIEHFAMPTRNIARLERFVREVLGGEPYCYAGYDDVDRKMGRKPHIFIRIGEILFQCTEEGGPMHPSQDDMSVSPHWAFSIEPYRLDGFMQVLRENNLPFAGPISQPQFGARSIYFMSPEGHKLEICAADARREGAKSASRVCEQQIDWRALKHDWAPKSETAELQNINPVRGGRRSRSDNKHGLKWMHHFTLPARDVALVNRFLIDLLDAERWSADPSPAATGPLRIGQSGFECTADAASPLYPVPGDNNISPHWSFGASAAALDHYKTTLEAAGLPVAGPYRHRSLDLVSIYFKSPEGHKFEIGTWEPYPPEKALLMGAPGVGFIPWPTMDHQWRP